MTGWIILSKKKSTAAGSERFTVVNAFSGMKLSLSTVGRRHWQQNFTAHTEDANLSLDCNLAQNRDGPVKLWDRTVWTDEHKIISVMIRQKCREKLD